MKHVIKPACSLFLIAAITTALLSFAHRFTLEPIENQRKRTHERIMIEVMGQADSFRELQTDTPGSIVRIFEGLSGEDIIGYVVELAPTGYAGPINMMVGILSTESKITGMRILRHNETPGLGSLATRERFYRRFDGRSLNPLRVVKYSPGVDEIEAITSSTITTKAITNAVNEAIEWYKEGGFR